MRVYFPPERIYVKRYSSKLRQIFVAALFVAPLIFALTSLPVVAYAQPSGGCTGVSNITVGSTTYVPTWCDEFNGAAGSPNTTTWKFDLGGGGWGNGEAEVYCGPAGYAGNPSQCPTTFSASTSPIYIDGSGHLVIRPINENGAWLSGRMNTEGKENFTYGILVASIELPNTTTQGLWAAWWTLGSDITTVPWPGCGEEDIMEDWSPQVDNGEGTTGDISTAHTTDTGGSGVGGRFTFPSGQAGNTAFHQYGLIWKANSLQTYVDNPSSPFLTITPSSLPSGDTWPFNQSMFVIFNVAVGGTLGGSTSGLASPAQPMLVDYVRWYTASSGTPPAAPTNLTATAVSSSQINLSWTASTTSGVTYTVLRGGTSIATGITGTTYSNTGLAASTQYSYTVEAVDSGGTSPASNTATATTQGGVSCTTVPSAPTGLVAAAVSSSAIGLNWTAVTPPANCTISSYSVYGSTTSGFTPGTGNLIASGVTSVSYTNTGLAASTTHYYKVEAVDADGTSAASAQAQATTQAASGEGPYGGTPAAIPGTVQAENYDTGGQGVAYNVTAVNGTGNGYRSDGVDLEVTTDTGGGYNLGWTAAGQWFKYTVNVATAGSYTVTFRVAAPAAVTDAFHLSNSSGTNLSGSVNVPATGGYQAWVNVTATVTLPAGTQTLTINQDKAGWNINWFAFASGGPPPTSIAINSGGLAVSPFAADEDFAGGTESSTATTITTTGVTNPAPEAVYQSQRFGNFTYTIPGYTAGSNHTVVLYFDEFYWTAAGKRVFNVSINGTQVLANFDVFAAAGGEFKAIDKTFTATANGSGQIVIVFTTVTDNAEVNGISVQ
jgi:beta-glucanase (GH16 family)